MMKKIADIFLVILFSSTLAAFVVGVVSYFYLDADMTGSLTRWQKLPEAPQQVIKLSGVDAYGDPYVETSSGKLYSSSLPACSFSTEDCWQGWDGKEEIRDASIKNCWYPFKIAPEPQDVLQRIDNCKGDSGVSSRSIPYY